MLFMEFKLNIPQANQVEKDITDYFDKINLKCAEPKDKQYNYFNSIR